MIDDELDGEDPVKVALRMVSEPTPEEREAHQAFHLPYRNWCQHCVAGRGRATMHKKVSRLISAAGAMMLSCDYGFLRRDRLEEETVPVLVIKDALTGMVGFHMADTKGVVRHHLDVMVDFIKLLGYRRIHVKSDNEPAIVAMKNELKKRLGEVGVDMALEEVPVGDSQGNGAAEQAVGQMQGLSRTLLSALECRLGKKLEVNSVVIPWLVRHAGTVQCLGARGRDGRTPWERAKNRHWHIDMPEFGERVSFKVHTSGKLQVRWQDGIFLGMILGSTERIVSIGGVVHKARSLKRFDAGQRWSHELVTSHVKETPWAARSIPSTMSPSFGDPVKKQQQEATPLHIKRMPIREADVARYGATPGCAGCRHHSAPWMSKAAHTEACRSRITVAISQHDPHRVAASEARVTNQMGEAVRQLVEGSTSTSSGAVLEGSGLSPATNLTTTTTSTSTMTPTMTKTRLDGDNDIHGEGAVPYVSSSSSLQASSSNVRGGGSSGSGLVRGGGGVALKSGSTKVGVTSSSSSSPSVVKQVQFSQQPSSSSSLTGSTAVSGQPLLSSSSSSSGGVVVGSEVVDETMQEDADDEEMRMHLSSLHPPDVVDTIIALNRYVACFDDIFTIWRHWKQISNEMHCVQSLKKLATWSL